MLKVTNQVLVGMCRKIDLGIAICHFLAVCDGTFVIDNPGIEVDKYTEYIATICCGGS